MNSEKAKVIAFYLPQYHCIPENDKWWGKGFTEWTNTKKAVPLFEGHYQPKTPLNQNYYNLLDPSVMREQAKLAKEYKIYGFCYYHYWFKNGKKLLEKPIENMLNDKEVDIPFCLSWANENWSRRWDGGKNEVIMPQDYGDKKEWKKHFDYLLSFFKDDRYIKIDGKPLLVIYKPQLIPRLGKMLDYFRERALCAGFPGLVLMSQHPSWITDKRYNKKYFDYIIKFEPFFTYSTMNKCISLEGNSFNNRIWNIINENEVLLKILEIGKKIRDVFSNMDKSDAGSLTIKDYDEYWNYILDNKIRSDLLISGAFTDWDNTARKVNGMMFQGASPEKFERYLSKLVINNQSKDKLVFINAWNEWAEGAYLEPDEKFGYSYLEAVKRALIK
ncbi:MAG: glycoside hydrolase family 99-like domain-containing protein [Eubacteriales bacterium]|nr:glycoside hydrolase family 99-like domain-containing protein [Eubacteriales bacterium]